MSRSVRGGAGNEEKCKRRPRPANINTTADVPSHHAANFLFPD